MKLPFPTSRSVWIPAILSVTIGWSLFLFWLVFTYSPVPKPKPTPSPDASKLTGSLPLSDGGVFLSSPPPVFRSPTLQEYIDKVDSEHSSMSQYFATVQVGFDHVHELLKAHSQELRSAKRSYSHHDDILLRIEQRLDQTEQRLDYICGYLLRQYAPQAGVLQADPAQVPFSCPE